MKRTILVVEDDVHIRIGLREALLSEGYTVEECGDGRHAVPLARDRSPDLIILDVMLPGRSGFDICRDLRSAGLLTPILMLTAKGQEIDKVVGLELGADDYVTKPFSVRELLARLQALLRRIDRERSPSATPALPPRIAFGAVEVDTAAMRVSQGGTTQDLTARELKVLGLLWSERGRVVSRERFLNEVWGLDYYGTTRTLDQVIVRLRQKLEADPADPRHILTVHGVGYRLEA